MLIVYHHNDQTHIFPNFGQLLLQSLNGWNGNTGPIESLAIDQTLIDRDTAIRQICPNVVRIWVTELQFLSLKKNLSAIILTSIIWYRLVSFWPLIDDQNRQPNQTLINLAIKQLASLEWNAGKSVDWSHTWLKRSTTIEASLSTFGGSREGPKST